MAVAPLVTVKSTAVGVVIKAIVLTDYWFRHIDSLSRVSVPDIAPYKILRAGNKIL